MHKQMSDFCVDGELDTDVVTGSLVNGDNDGILGVVVLMVLHIAAGLVSALLSISRLTLTGQKLKFT